MAADSSLNISYISSPFLFQPISKSGNPLLSCFHELLQCIDWKNVTGKMRFSLNAFLNLPFEKALIVCLQSSSSPCSSSMWYTFSHSMETNNDPRKNIEWASFAIGTKRVKVCSFHGNCHSSNLMFRANPHPTCLLCHSQKWQLESLRSKKRSHKTTLRSSVTTVKYLAGKCNAIFLSTMLSSHSGSSFDMIATKKSPAQPPREDREECSARYNC